MWLAVKNVLFTALVPGKVGIYVPLYLARNASSVARWLPRERRG